MSRTYLNLTVLGECPICSSRTSHSCRPVNVRGVNLTTIYNHFFYFMYATNIHKHIFWDCTQIHKTYILSADITHIWQMTIYDKSILLVIMYVENVYVRGVTVVTVIYTFCWGDTISRSPTELSGAGRWRRHSGWRRHRGGNRSVGVNYLSDTIRGGKL